MLVPGLEIPVRKQFSFMRKLFVFNNYKITFIMEIYIYSGGWSSSAEVPAAHTPAVPPATQESEVLAIAPGPEHYPPKALYPEPHAQPALGSLSAETPIEHHVDAVFELAPKPLKHGTSASSTLFPVIQLELGAALAELPISQSDDKLLFKTFKFGRIYFISFNFNFSTPKNQCKKKTAPDAVNKCRQ